MREMSNYAKARGVVYSAYARAEEIYRKVNAEEGPDVARQKFNDYLRWFLMVPDLLEMVGEMEQEAVAVGQ